MRVMQRLIQLSVMSLVLAQPACAAKKDEPAKLAAPAAGVAETTIRAALGKQFPRHTVGEIRKAPVAGLYEVVIGKEVIYTDAQARYVLFGDLVDIQKQQSLTEMRKSEMMKGAFGQLPLADAIKVVRGKGERQMAVFTDPDCPYCKILDQDKLRTIDNVTIYYYLLPLDALHPDARRKSQKVWCSEDRAKAWYDLIYEGKESAAKEDCATPLDRIQKLARDLGFSGTPGLFFPDGTRVPGAVATEKIEELLNQSHGKK